MSNCYFCYKPAGPEEKYHKKCCKRFFGTEVIPELQLDDEILTELAKETINQRISVTGVQPKISLDLLTGAKGNRLTIVGLWGKFILKPQNKDWQEMPEVEDLTMHLAELFKIATAEHCLLPTQNGEFVYIAKRFDRIGNFKVHMEDFCQLGEFQTEQKYHSSYERCGKLIKEYCTNSGLDTLNYFELLIFSFLSGNNDMHMKNFSLLHGDKEILFSPAYDLVNGNLVNPKDKEDMALTLNGRKSKIKHGDFEMLGENLGISKATIDRVFKKFAGTTAKVFNLIDQSFLSADFKEGYRKIWLEKLSRLE